MNRALLKLSSEKSEERKTVSVCLCGCKEETGGGEYKPGHDQRLRIELEERVGGLLVMRQLVDAMESYVEGGRSLEELGKVVRRAFWTKRGA